MQLELDQIVFLGNSLTRWLIALIVALGSFLLLTLIRRLLVVRLDAMARRTINVWDDLVLALVRRLHGITLFTWAVWIGISILVLPQSAVKVAWGITVIILGIQLAIWGDVIIARVLEARVMKLQSDDPASASTLAWVTLVARGVLWVVLVLLALDNLGVNISTLVAGLGIGGVAIALATQNILGDLFGSLSITLDKPFVVGDFIVVGDMQGTVQHIGLKTTRLISLSGEQLIFSNADLLSSRIRNFKRMAERRVEFAIGVPYQTPQAALERIPGILAGIVRSVEGIRFERAHFKTFADATLIFEVVYHLPDPDYTLYMDVQQRINLDICRQFEAAGIDVGRQTRITIPRPVPVSPTVSSAESTGPTTAPERPK